MRTTYAIAIVCAVTGCVSDDSSTAKVGTDDFARTLVRSISETYQITTHDPLLPTGTPGMRHSLLRPPPQGTRYIAAPGGWIAFRDDVQRTTHRAHVTLPSRADGLKRVLDLDSGLAIEIG